MASAIRHPLGVTDATEAVRSSLFVLSVTVTAAASAGSHANRCIEAQFLCWLPLLLLYHSNAYRQVQSLPTSTVTDSSGLTWESAKSTALQGLLKVAGIYPEEFKAVINGKLHPEVKLTLDQAVTEMRTMQTQQTQVTTTSVVLKKNTKKK